MRIVIVSYRKKKKKNQIVQVLFFSSTRLSRWQFYWELYFQAVSLVRQLSNDFTGTSSQGVTYTRYNETTVDRRHCVFSMLLFTANPLNSATVVHLCAPLDDGKRSLYAADVSAKPRGFRVTIAGITTTAAQVIFCMNSFVCVVSREESGGKKKQTIMYLPKSKTTQRNRTADAFGSAAFRFIRFHTVREGVFFI